jgi:hypothetical protein
LEIERYQSQMGPKPQQQPSQPPPPPQNNFYNAPPRQQDEPASNFEVKTPGPQNYGQFGQQPSGQSNPQQAGGDTGSYKSPFPPSSGQNEGAGDGSYYIENNRAAHRRRGFDEDEEPKNKGFFGKFFGKQ